MVRNSLFSYSSDKTGRASNMIMELDSLLKKILGLGKEAVALGSSDWVNVSQLSIFQVAKKAYFEF